MTELPEAAPRRPIHTRRITFEGFLRDDGLWDIDCELSDTKAIEVRMPERGVLPPGEPIHLLRVRLTVDDGFTVRAVQAASTKVPWNECHGASDEPMRKLVGLTMGPGWRQKIDGAIGGTAGCTHLRELVFNAATAAFQMIPHYREVERGGERAHAADSDKPPFYMGKCWAWRFDGPVVQQHAPRFFRIAKA
jgi:hypothetical protein